MLATVPNWLPPEYKLDSEGNPPKPVMNMWYTGEGENTIIAHSLMKDAEAWAEEERRLLRHCVPELEEYHKTRLSCVKAVIKAWNDYILFTELKPN